MSTFTEHTFPHKLYACLLDLEAQGLSHIASFQTHGRCFLVHQPHILVKQILAKWFRQTKYASFQRQLNIYGFQRISSGPDKNAYYHPSFLQGRPNLLCRIRRISVKGTGPRTAGSLDDQPIFDTLPPLECGAMASTSDESGVSLYRDQRVKVTNDVLPSRVTRFQHSGVGTEHGIWNHIAPTPMTELAHPFGTYDLPYSLNVARVLPAVDRATVLDALATSNGWNAMHVTPEMRRVPRLTDHMDPPHWGSLAAVQAAPPSPTALALLRVVQERQELQAQEPGWETTRRLLLSTHQEVPPHWASLAAVPVAHPSPAALALLRVVQERQRHAPQSTRHELDALATSNAWNSMRIIPEPGSETTRRLPLWTDHANPPHWASLAAVPAAHPSSTTLALVRAAQERRPQEPLSARPNVAALWAAFRRYE